MVLMLLDFFTYYYIMYSRIIRLLYSLSYFTLFAFLLEIYNVAVIWGEISIYWDLCSIREFCFIHYPVLIIVVLLCVSKSILKRAERNLSKTQILVKKSSPFSLESCLLVGQFIPFFTFTEKLIGKSSTTLTSVLTIVSILLLSFLMDVYGGFNLSMFFLGYNQYRVSTDSTEYWLISKRKINNFSSSFTVVEISDKVLMRL